MTVRQGFYQAAIAGVVDKTEDGYEKVQRMYAKLRREKILPWDWIDDYTRWRRKPTTDNSLADAIKRTAEHYRRALWQSADAYVEVWLEKDALAGVIYPVTQTYDVPLMVARGYSSLSFLYGAAEHIAGLRKPAYIFHLGDHDPSGVNAAKKIEETLSELAPDAEIHFERLAVLPWQISEWNLPTRPTKQSDSRAKAFGYADSVELDAIHPDRLRDLVEQAILRHISEYEIEVLQVAEEYEREALMSFHRDLSAR
ncbi:MAG: hypothetical protein ABI612_23640 [Betaproteobacteria bacterium]